MYYRLYPSKGNTIFQQYNPNTTSPQTWSQTTNTGATPVMQVMDGAGASRVLLGFNMPTWLYNKLTTNSFTCNIKYFDAGAVYDSLLPMKSLTLETFPSDFSEGDGWSFNQANATTDISNWLNNLDGNLWSEIAFTSVSSLYLNKDNQDLCFDVSSAISSTLSENTQLNFSLRVTTPQLDQNILIKFLWGRHTKTVFRPYLEFFINDEVSDSAYNLLAGTDNQVYFINENGVPFTGPVTASVTLNNNTVVPATATVVGNGVYYILVNPTEPALINKKEYVSIIWSINSNPCYKQILNVKPNNQFIQDIDYTGVMFYPTTPYINNIVRHGDVIPFQIISQIRGQNDVVLDTYQYRIVSQDGFELTPWTDVSVYRDKMFFYVDTCFFYPELQYEVFVKNQMQNFSITSSTSYKFKLVANDASHLRELSASPYYSRQTFFSK